MDADRRQHSRFKKTLLVIIHRPHNERRTETADISLGGATIHNAQKYYDIGQMLHIEIVPEEEGSIFSNARVISIYPRSKNASTYRINLEFIDMSDDDKKRLENCIKTIGYNGNY